MSFTSPRILWLIPARSGSKSIPDKNIRDLKGLPLLAYRIKSALSISDKENVWCSTDSRMYADIAASVGASVPFIRPGKLSGDLSSSNDVVQHAMDHAEKQGKTYDIIGLLEPTSPFIYADDLISAVSRLWESSDADSIVAVRESRPNSIFVQEESEYLDLLAKNLKKIELQGRQSQKKEITPSGGFYISKWNAFKRNHSFYTEKTLAFRVAPESELEIDEETDWLWAEFLLEKKIIDVGRLYK